MYGILEQFPEPVARKIFVDNAFPVTLIKQVSLYFSRAVFGLWGGPLEP